MLIDRDNVSLDATSLFEHMQEPARRNVVGYRMPRGGIW